MLKTVSISEGKICLHYAQNLPMYMYYLCLNAYSRVLWFALQQVLKLQPSPVHVYNCLRF